MSPDNKTKIVSAATQCFIRKGFHATSMRDIAKAAGVSLGNIYNHFDRKTDLVLAISDGETAGIVEATEFFENTDMPTLPAIMAFVDEYLKEVTAPGVGVLIIEIAAEAARNDEVAKAFQGNHKKLCQALSDFLHNGQQKGEINREINADQAGELVIDIIEGLATRCCLSGKKPSRAAIQEMKLLIESYLGAK